MCTDFTINWITLISLLVNAVTVYRWITSYQNQKRLNDQAFHMVMGLALGTTRRVNMIVKRLESLSKQEGQENSEAMIYLENSYSDAKISIESLLSTAKALKPERADSLPYDSDSLLTESIVRNLTVKTKQKELQDKFG